MPVYLTLDDIGETWNLMKIGYQLKQVRERLAKGLVDKGVLRTEKRNFLLFDMATHPVADGGAKEELHKRVRNICSSRTVMLPPNPFLPEDIEFRYLRTIALVCAAYAANVLENALVTMGHEARERAFAQVDELLAEYSQWPFVSNKGAGAHVIGANLPQAVSEEVEKAKDKELQLEVSQNRIIILFPVSFFQTNISLVRYRSWPLVWVYLLALTPYSKRHTSTVLNRARSMSTNVLYLHFVTSTVSLLSIIIRTLLSSSFPSLGSRSKCVLSFYSLLPLRPTGLLKKDRRRDVKMVALFKSYRYDPVFSIHAYNPIFFSILFHLMFCLNSFIARAV